MGRQEVIAMKNRTHLNQAQKTLIALVAMIIVILQIVGCAEKDHFEGMVNSHWIGTGDREGESWCMSFEDDRLLKLITYNSATNESTYNYGIYNLMRGKKIRTLIRFVEQQEYEVMTQDWKLVNWDSSKFAQELNWVVTELSEDRFVWVSKGLLKQGDLRVAGENENRNEYRRTASCDSFIESIPENAGSLSPAAIE